MPRNLTSSSLRSGQAMLIAILTLGGAILGATSLAGLLLLYQIRATTDSANSAKAIFAADSGVNWALYSFFEPPASGQPGSPLSCPIALAAPSNNSTANSTALTASTDHVLALLASTGSFLAKTYIHSAEAAGTIYYVDASSPVASDANPGTEAAPWATIQHAADVAVAGDTVYVKAGTYTGNVRPANSGNASAGPITFSAYPGEEQEAIINGGTFQVETSYITVSGFYIENAPYQGILVQGPGVSNVIIDGNYTYNTGTSGIAAWGVPWESDPATCDDKCITNLTIENNTIDHANNPSLPGEGYDEQLDIVNGVDSFVVSGNTLINAYVANPSGPGNGGEGIDCKEGVSNGVVRNNTIYDDPRFGIYLDAGASDIAYYSKPSMTINLLVYDNVIHDVPTHGMMIDSEGRGGFDGVYVFNNIIYNNGSDGIDVYQYSGSTGSMNNINILNNTIYNNADMTTYYGGVEINNPIATNVTVRNNIVTDNAGFQITVEDGSTATVDHNITTGNPFVDAADADFHLAAGSPAIGAGQNLTSLGIPALDVDMGGGARPATGAWDAGAYQFGTVDTTSTPTSTPPSPPPSTPAVPTCAALGNGATVQIICYAADGTISSCDNPSASYAVSEGASSAARRAFQVYLATTTLP
jgi:hypothetical protein